MNAFCINSQWTDIDAFAWLLTITNEPDGVTSEEVVASVDYVVDQLVQQIEGVAHHQRRPLHPQKVGKPAHLAYKIKL